MADGNLSWLKELCCDLPSSALAIRLEERFHKVLSCRNAIQNFNSVWISGSLTVWCWLLLSEQDVWSIPALKLHQSFQQPDHGRFRTRRGDVPNSIDDGSDGFLHGQRHDIVSAILLLRLNALYQQPLNATDIAAHGSWVHLSRWRDDAPNWKNQIY